MFFSLDSNQWASILFISVIIVVIITAVVISQINKKVKQTIKAANADTYEKVLKPRAEELGIKIDTNWTVKQLEEIIKTEEQRLQKIIDAKKQKAEADLILKEAKKANPTKKTTSTTKAAKTNSPKEKDGNKQEPSAE